MSIQKLLKQLAYLLAQARAASHLLHQFPLSDVDKRFLYIHAVRLYQLGETVDEVQKGTHPFHGVTIMEKDDLPYVVCENEIIEQQFPEVEKLLTREILLQMLLESLHNAEETASNLLKKKKLSEQDRNSIANERKNVRRQYLQIDYLRLADEIKNRTPWDKSYFIAQYVLSHREFIQQWSEDLSDHEKRINLKKLNLSLVNFDACKHLRDVDLAESDVSEASLGQASGLTVPQLLTIKGFQQIKDIPSDLLSLAQKTRANKYLSVLDSILEEANDHRQQILALNHLDYFICNGTAPDLKAIPEEIFRNIAITLMTSHQLNGKLPTYHRLSYVKFANLTYKKMAERKREDIENDVLEILSSHQNIIAEETIALEKCSKYWKYFLGITERPILSTIKNGLSALTEEQKNQVQNKLAQIETVHKALKDQQASLLKIYEQAYMNALLANLHGQRFSNPVTPYERLVCALNITKGKPDLVADVRTCDLKDIDLSRLDLTDLRLRLTPQQAERLTKSQQKQRNAMLRQAMNEENEAQVLEYLEDGIDINIPDEQGRTALMAACMSNNVKLVTLLLQKGADPNRITQSGWRIIEAVSRMGSEFSKIVKTLMQAGATLDIENAIILGDDELIQKYFSVDKLYKVDALNEKEGKSLLHIAIEYNRPGVVQLLLEKFRADPSIATKQGQAPLHLACEKGNLEIIEKLLACKKVNINCEDRRHRTPIQIAIQEGHLNVAQLLSAKGAQLDVRCAVALGKLKELQQMLKGNLNLKVSGATALHWAVDYERYDIIHWLLDFHVEINPIDNQSRTPLYRACAKGDVKMAEFLIQQGAIVNPTDPAWPLPLQLVVEKQDKAMLALLLKYKADPNLSCSGHTLLHQAANLGNAQLVESLLAAGANPFALDAMGQLPLHCAITQGHAEVVKILLAAVLQFKNTAGVSAYEIAKKGNPEIMMLFERLQLLIKPAAQAAHSTQSHSPTVPGLTPERIERLMRGQLQAAVDHIGYAHGLEEDSAKAIIDRIIRTTEHYYDFQNGFWKSNAVSKATSETTPKSDEESSPSNDPQQLK